MRPERCRTLTNRGETRGDVIGRLYLRDSESVPFGMEQGMRVRRGFIRRPTKPKVDRTLFAPHGNGSMYAKNGQLIALAKAMASGMSARAAARLVGADKDTATKLARHLKDVGVVFPCACGKPVGHREWCSTRYARSPRRQDVMRRMQERRKSRSVRRVSIPDA